MFQKGAGVQKYLKAGYLILMCSALALYMKDGYFELGEAKGILYLVLSGGFAAAFAISKVVGTLLKARQSVASFSFGEKRSMGPGQNRPENAQNAGEDNESRRQKVWHMPLVIASGVFLLTNILTLVFAADKKVAFFGLEGWRTGFLTVALMLFFMWIYGEKVTAGGTDAQSQNAAANSKGKAFEEGEIFESPLFLAALLITPSLEFILAILGRFGIYPIDIYAQNDSFLATIGNINWYVSYLSVFVPLGAGLSACAKPFGRRFFLLSIYTFLGLLALLLQGSESGGLVLLGTYGVLLFMSLYERKDFKRFVLQLFILGLSMETAACLMLVLGGRYTYDANALTDICSRHVGLVLMALSLFLYRLSRFFEEVKGKWRGALYLKICLIAGAVFIAASTLVAAGRFNYDFGNGRGMIWAISLDIYKELPFMQKIFGVGQDCFSVYAYRDPSSADSLMSIFEGNTLTNAHSEVITILIERGLLGLLSYLFLVGSALFVMLQNKRKPAAKVCMLPVIAYFLNSLVSFTLPVSTPFMFILLGLGASGEYPPD